MKYRPLHCLVHISRTAGSTVNEVMANSGMDAWPHIEGQKHNDLKLGQIENSAEFISGHIPFREFRAIISQYISRKLVFHTFIREPPMQVASYYYWLIEIFYRGVDFYETHPPEIKDMSLKIRCTDNKNSKLIINNLEQYSDFFLNLQTYYLLDKRNFTSLIDELSALDYTWFLNKLDDFFKQVCSADYTIPTSDKPNYNFRKEIFLERKIQEFLNIYNSFDNKILSKTIKQV